MAIPPADSLPRMGQYYALRDYAGLIRRFMIIAIDGGVVAVAGIAVMAIDQAVRRKVSDGVTAVTMYSWLAFRFGYFVLLEASALGTLGFLMTGVKIVTLKGDRPSMLRMTFRLLLWILGPINVIVDLFWLTGDDYKQTLRDKFAGTLVVRKSAIPAGTGEIRLNRYQFLGHSFVFYEVQKPVQT